MSAWIHRWLATLLYVLFLVVVVFVLGKFYYDLHSSRQASCKATLIALGGIKSSAKVGIRPVPAVPADLEEPLRSAFLSQAETTASQNERYKEVIARVSRAAKDLQQSSFCQ